MTRFGLMLYRRGSSLLPRTFSAVFLLSLVATVVAAAPAHAGPTPEEAEIVAQYRHSLDRLPDRAGLDQYLAAHTSDCRWTIVNATYRIAASTEAINRWRVHGSPHLTAQNLAGMLYASLLRRAPDPNGLRTYTHTVRNQGLGWAAKEMMASAEYENRLRGLCVSRPTSNAKVHSWESAIDFANNTLIPAMNGANRTCDFMSLVQVTHKMGVKQIPKTAKGVRLFFEAHRQITSMAYNSLDGSCKLALQYARAIHRITEHVANGNGYNAVFIQYDLHKPWYDPQTTITLRIGDYPDRYETFRGRSWMD